MLYWETNWLQLRLECHEKPIHYYSHWGGNIFLSSVGWWSKKLFYLHKSNHHHLYHCLYYCHCSTFDHFSNFPISPPFSRQKFPIFFFFFLSLTLLGTLYFALQVLFSLAAPVFPSHPKTTLKLNDWIIIGFALNNTLISRYDLLTVSSTIIIIIIWQTQS